MSTPSRPREAIVIRGARQNNLKNITIELPARELIVVTGVSGSGKSSLVFDTLYAEGQRRYVETFSPYARQFLDRMDKPQVDAIEGIPPAIAIDQTNPVRTSRSTVGTMTELNDHLKLLYARAAHLHCRGCGRPVRRDTPDSIYEDASARAKERGDPRLAITFPVPVPENFSGNEVRALLERQGYTRIHAETPERFDVVQDRVRLGNSDRSRVVEALEAALRVGNGRVAFQLLDAGEPSAGVQWRYSSDLHCAECDIHYQEPVPALFSFNSPVGACESCRGFGRVIGIDFGLVVPDESKTLREGAVRPWQTPSYRECQDDLMKYAARRGIPVDIPWRRLGETQRHWVMQGEPEWVNWDTSWPGIWYGVARFFTWLETKAYKMHVRVLLSKYRAYTECTTCGGARLKTDALLWRLGDAEASDSALPPTSRFVPTGVTCPPEQFVAHAGLTLHDIALLPVSRTKRFFDEMRLSAPFDEAADLVLTEIRARLDYLCEVGLGYLTLDRQSRTLSGGEVQRINLTTALGTSLVNTLFVLDEPSIGLHPRDMGRVIQVMQRLRDAGNSLVVVEHDPQIMVAADRLIDIGPGPGAAGGTIVFEGNPENITKSDTSITGAYLSGRRRIPTAPAAVPGTPTDYLTVRGAREHNLRSVDVSVPLNRLVCVTGVSGSGKSTLVEDVLYRALLKYKGKATELPGAHDSLDGAEKIGDVVLVDQSPIGRTTRSTPASYVGAFDAIRAVYATLPVSRERGYTTGTFSFNSGNGRCPTCGGNGFEHVEMQFLSDVYLRCADCDGRRYRREIEDVKLEGQSIADALEMTVAEALAFFAEYPAVRAALEPLTDVGLEYLKLGQPVPTLSGGEAQRLKLAGHLTLPRTATGKRKPAAGNTLFLFDEPTTGLHFDDVAKLLRAMRKLLAAGHTLVVIEHNLDVIRASDWVLDLGPEGGEAGGQVMFTGTPRGLALDERSHTGAALREYETSLTAFNAREIRTTDRSATGVRPVNAIQVHHAREHNLKNVDVTIPHGEFTVITGVSGSGKSTLAFDIIFAEGQRRYLESLNAYARQFVQSASRPDVDAIFGIPPTVAIEQRTSRGGHKSTVATLTEIYHFLRLLYVKLGRQYCPDCDVPIEPQTEDAIVARLMRDYRGQHIGLLAPLIVNRKGIYTDLARWAAKKGHTHLRVDREFTTTQPWPRLARFQEHSIELPVGDIVVTPRAEPRLRELLAEALEHGKGVVHVMGQLDTLKRAMEKNDPSLQAMTEAVFSVRRACPSCNRSFPELDPRLFSFNSKHGWCQTCYGTGLKISEVNWDEERGKTGAEDHVLDSWLEWLEIDEACPACDGRRLNREALAVRFHDQSIAAFTAQPVVTIRDFFAKVRLSGREADIARDILAEIVSRLAFLDEVGLGYLALDRSAPTLSGGEAQRIRLAAQLGSNLRGVCYVLDEPTIGLHPRDNRILLSTLQKLRQKGNTLIVVEHDEDTIRCADHVIDLGPGAGRLGGEVIAAGTADDLMRTPGSITGRYLAHPLLHAANDRRIGRQTRWVTVKRATLHNLQGIDARIPLGALTVVSGVSGSGKSSLARDVLRENLTRRVGAARGKGAVPLFGCKAIVGYEHVTRIMEVDQTPIGKTPRSCPATYVGFWDAIRRLFAEVPEARMRGYTASRFSFNTAGGRCEVCEGQGIRRIEMNFLPDVRVTCEACGGARFNGETLAIRFKDRSIGEVLAMSIDDALPFFGAHPAIAHSLQLMQDVGLGYLTLGQQSPTLSGGEAQRIKLVTELARVRQSTRPGPQPASHALYVLDEPTVGLHMADVEKLIAVLHRLVDADNTVVVIEHNLDVIAEADWLVDLGPEGGSGGGCIVAEGPPAKIAAAAGGKTNRSHTAAILKEFLAERTAPAT